MNIAQLAIAFALNAALAALTHAQDAVATQDAAPPTNRVVINESVRKNLGITFATVERRAVGQSLRVPGRFELLPSATRQYHSPVKGQVEVLVHQYDRVLAGTPLYRLESGQWSELLEQISSLRARVQAMGPLREAHKVHEQSLNEKLQLWQSRLTQLEELRNAGGGSATQFAEARAQLSGARADLAELNEKSAELHAQQMTFEAELRGLLARRDFILKSAGSPAASGEASPPSTIEVRAIGPGVVDAIGASSGALVEDGALVLSVVQPDQIRFRAKAMQSDLGRLREGARVNIVPPAGPGIPTQDQIAGTLTLGLTADPDERTVDLIVQPQTRQTWARAGVSAQLEIALEGGSEELAIPRSAVVMDGTTPVIFRRDPKDPDKAIRQEADLGVTDGKWVVIASGLKEGDQVVQDGIYQLMLATSGSAPSGGHFHSDGTYHEGKD